MLTELAVAQFTLRFKQELIQLQGLISFSLILYWFIALFPALRAALQPATSGKTGSATGSRLDFAWTTVCGVLGCLLLGMLLLDWGNEYFVLAVAIASSLTLALLHPSAAVCFLTSLLFLRPWELIQENDYFAMLPKLTFNLCIAHVILIYATIFAKTRKIEIVVNNTFVLMIVFGAWALLTTFKTPDPAAAQFAFSETIMKSGFLFFMILNALRSPKDLKLLVGTLIITFLAVGLISIYQTRELIDATRDTDTRLIGIGAFSNSNDIAALMVFVFPFCMMNFLRRTESFLSRFTSLVVMAVALVAVYMSQSRGAMIGLMAVIGIYTVLTIKNRFITLLAVTLCVLAVPAYMTISSRDSSDLEGSSTSRMTYIKTGLVMAAKNPVLGVGFQAYPENFERYATEIVLEWGHRTAHNSWILVLAETGLLGFALFVAMFVTAWKKAWKIFPQAPEFFLSLVGYGIAITFLSHSYLLYPYLLYALIGVASRVYSTQPTAVPVTGVQPLSNEVFA
ncbi:MAG: O-antigen ligase family protein [Methylotenera sp.]|nr:O-antigen ligase family protein [Oligoflexia bacterium]